MPKINILLDIYNLFKHNMYGFQQPYAQPAYVAPPPMYGGYGRPPAGPTVIHINNDDKD